jgi:hypothetical protein
MDTLTLIAFLCRVTLVVVYAYMTSFFQKGYKKSVEAGVPNKFFSGFMFVFYVLVFVIAIHSTYDLLKNFYPGIKVVEGRFPGGDNPANLAQVGIFDNMTRPLFVFFFIIVTLVIAGQVYPLEGIMNWNKKPITKIMVSASVLMMLIYIPMITYTIVTQIIFIWFFFALALGFFLDIGINIMLFFKTTGQIRTQSLYVVIAFFFFYGGFAMTLEMGWMEQVWSGFDSLRYDIIFGVILQIISTILYRKAFTQEQ